MLLASLQAGPAAAGLLQVPEEHPTIAEALATSSSGDTVSIAPGTYYEHDLVWPMGVSILGRTSNPGGVVVDAQYQGRVLSGENLSSLDELAYLTLRNGDAAWWPGSGLMVTGDPSLHDLIIEDCRNSGSGTGLYIDGGATITDCVLRNNRSTAAGTKGGGARLDTWAQNPVRVQNVEVHGNQAESGSGLYINGRYAHVDGLYCHDNLGTGLEVSDVSAYGGGPTIENSLFVDNIGSAIYFFAELTLRNCTIVGNGPQGSGWGALACWSTWDYPHHPIIAQCIIANNKGSGISWYEPSPYTIECNDVYGNVFANYINIPDLTGEDGNVSLDPQFCSRGGGYELQADSPCAPENNDCGLLMGAYPVACGDTAARATSWGHVKSLY
jgi:hypothetical protein